MSQQASSGTTVAGSGIPTSVGGATAAGKVTYDYSGSRDEWEERVIRALISRYKQGLGGMPGYGDASIGKPAEEDFGTPDKPLSYQTVQYFENYVKKFGASDPWILENFGTPPERRATYVDDPNSRSSVEGTWKERSEFQASENQKDRDAQMAIAQLQANTQLQSVRERIAADLSIAAMEDATRRYIAEGDWGVQKYIAELQEKGAMDRLLLELGARDKDRAQRAIEERNRHHEAMVGLALEIAKYDAELAAEPRNWLKYAAWLQNRDVVVNGLTLTMAAQLVPEDQIDPQEVAQSGGSSMAVYQTAVEQYQALISGQSGGSMQPLTQEMVNSWQPQGGPGVGGMQLPPGAATMWQERYSAGQGEMKPAQPTIGAQQLAGVTDYGALARQLLGMNPLESSAAQASQENLQGISNSLRTTMSGGGRVASFGNYTGPTTNALGVTVSEPTGQKVDYRQFSRLLPSQQQMKLGEISSLGRYEPDFIKEMEKSRPKGFATGAASFG